MSRTTLGARMRGAQQHVAEFRSDGYYLDNVLVTSGSGPFSWVVPAGVRALVYSGCGGAGGGGGGYQAAAGGGGGGGGSGLICYRREVAVFPGDTLTVTIGAGGTAGSGGAAPTAGGDGGTTSVVATTSLSANLLLPGGRGGTAMTAAALLNTGTVSGNVNDTAENIMHRRGDRPANLALSVGVAG